jgi:hypothetical protein
MSVVGSHHFDATSAQAAPAPTLLNIKPTLQKKKKKVTGNIPVPVSIRPIFSPDLFCFRFVCINIIKKHS